MAINFSRQVYTPAFNVFARPVIFTGGASPSSARGIYDTVPIDVAAEDGTIVSEQRTILDILEEEFTVLPVQGDRVTIPASADLAAIGEFEIIETKPNGGGELTMVLRKIVEAKP